MATFRWKKGRMYTKHSKRYTDKQRAAYWKKKYLACRTELKFYRSKSWKRAK